MRIPFTKMHGLENDFVILDARAHGVMPNAVQCRRIANRRSGVGCDQIIVLDKPKNPAAHLYMHILNPDGSDGGACGNATRCVALLEMTQGQQKIIIETGAGLLPVTRMGQHFMVDMGPARIGWKEIPLAHDHDTLHVDVGVEGLPTAVCVNMGNPHAVFFVDDLEAIDLTKLGAVVETSALFPARTNVEFAVILDQETIRMRVWERGAGMTQACGSGACATLVAAARRGLTGQKAKLLLDGGVLDIAWQENNHVMMSGPATLSYRGELDNALLTSAS